MSKQKLIIRNRIVSLCGGEDEKVDGIISEYNSTKRIQDKTRLGRKDNPLGTL